MNNKGSKIFVENGYKIYDGYAWVYYTKTKCDICKKELFRRQYNVKRKQKFVCKECKNIYVIKNKDQKIYNILNNKTPHFYYLLGLIASDGYISWPGCTDKARGYNCEITLKNTDKCLLYKLQNMFGGKLYEYKKYTKWLICSQPFIEYLRSIGFTNNKSLTLDIEKWIKTITEKEQIYFLRGLFDGDGSIYKTKRGGWGAEISCYSPHMLNTICKICSKFNIHKESNRMVLWGKYIIPFIETIYKEDNCFFMERKYNKAKQLIKEINHEN